MRSAMLLGMRRSRWPLLRGRCRGGTPLGAVPEGRPQRTADASSRRPTRSPYRGPPTPRRGWWWPGPSASVPAPARAMPPQSLPAARPWSCWRKSIHASPSALRRVTICISLGGGGGATRPRRRSGAPSHHSSLRHRPRRLPIPLIAYAAAAARTDLSKRVHVRSLVRREEQTGATRSATRSFRRAATPAPWKVFYTRWSRSSATPVVEWRGAAVACPEYRLGALGRHISRGRLQRRRG